MPEFIDPVFAETSPNRSFSMIENELLGLQNLDTGVFYLTLSMTSFKKDDEWKNQMNVVFFVLNSGTDIKCYRSCS